MNPPTHSLIIVTADLADADRLRSELSADVQRLIVQRCDDLANELFAFDRCRISSRLSDSGVFTAVCPDGARVVAAAVSLVQAFEATSSPAHIRLRVAIHIIDASESSLVSAADVRYANVLRQSAHGGQVLISAAAQQAVQHALPSSLVVRDLGKHQMPDLSQPANVYQLMSADSPHVFPPIHTLNGARHNLVTPVSRFIGREAIVAEVRSLLLSTRMVTLTGAPGIGKTRLAIHTAAALVNELADGAWFVDIPQLPDPSLLVPSIAAAIKVNEDPATTLLESVVTSLKSRKVLIVLDGCDLIRGACAATVETLLARCPGVYVMATGAERLGLQHEHEYSVTALTLPEAGIGSSPTAIRSSEAGELFNLYACTANPEYVLTYANSRAVSQIVNASAGIPFALYAIAHAVRILEMEPLAAALEAQLKDITIEPPASDHLVSRSIVEWCYQRLDRSSRDVLSRLAVMIGPFTLAAMQAVAPGSRESARLNDVPSMLTYLIGAGLVTSRMQSGVPRYRVPDSVRNYALEQLDAGERSRARRRYAEYYLRMAEEACDDLAGTDAARTALWLEKEYANLCAALAWCREDPEQSDTGLRLAQALRKYWEARGYPGEGQALLLGAAVWGDRNERTTARADALKRAGDSAFQSGNLEAAKARHQEALSINQELGDKARQAINLNNLGGIARAEGDHAAALGIHEQALALNRQIGDSRREAVNLHNIGNAHRDLGSLEDAQRLYEEAIEVSLKLGDHLAIGHNLNSLARLAYSANDRTTALMKYEEAVTHFRLAGSQSWVAHNLAEIDKLNLRNQAVREAAPA